MNKFASLERVILLSLLTLLAACGSGGGGDDGGGDDGGGGGSGGGSGTTPVLMPTIESIQSEVLDAQCTSCHIGATAPLGLRLDINNAYALLVGVPSVQEPSLLRVDPGNPDDSYLIRKLEGTQSVGGRMPLGLNPLPAADIAIVRQWIADGAQPPAGQTPSEPIRVSSLSPLPDSTVPAIPMTVIAVFDREVAATSVDATTFLVERSGGDGTFGDGNEVDIVPVSVSVPLANPMTAVFDMSTTAMVNDTYRVTLVGTGPAMIQDLDANNLDGEYSGSFPSGDGTGGGNFQAEFEVAGIEPTLSSIQDNVFTPTCSGCHTGPQGGALPAGLDLSSLSASFTGLVNAPSTQNGALDLVEPGDPDASYLILKLEGTQSVGAQMPFLATPLDAGTIAAIRQWISDGAQM